MKVTMKPTISISCADTAHSRCENPNECQCQCHQRSNQAVKPACPPHEPHNLGMIIAGPSKTGLMIERIQLHLCVKCWLFYGEALPSVPPGMVGRQN